MFPLGDASRKTLRFPIITVILVGINILVFLMELSGGREFVMRWAVIPSEIASGQNLITLFTAIFMHGSILHIAANMLFLQAFGPQIEDTMGPLRYIVFYLLGGIVAFIAQVAFNPGSSVPTLGASGAIAAVMGAFLVTYPKDKIRTVLIIVVFIHITFLPAILLIGIWFVLQLISGLGSMVETQAGGVAYLAHVGGFVYGMLVNRFFMTDKRLARKRRQN